MHRIKKLIKLMIHEAKRERIDWKSLNNRLSKAIFAGFNDDEKIKFNDVYWEIEEELTSKGFKYLDEGSKRVTFLSPSKRWIIKVPKDDYGINNNVNEARYWNKVRAEWIKNGEDVRLARCKMMGVFLVMEFVDININPDDKPSWADFIDCGQVGRNRNGKIVAYDFA